MSPNGENQKAAGNCGFFAGRRLKNQAMFDLVFLGTSASVPSAERNHPGLLVAADSRRVLVDCGEGTQRQLLRAGAGFRRLGRLLLTHGHLDHVLGIPGLLSTLGLQHASAGMTVNGGPRTLGQVARLLEALWGKQRAPVPLQLASLADREVIAEPGFSITAFSVRHGDTDSLGYAFESIPRRHLRRDRLAALGVPDGAIRKELAEGRRATLPDGRVIDPADVLEPEESRSKLVVVGDAGSTDGLEDPARGADLLVIEASFLQRDASIARAYGHLTAAEAAALARDAGVKRLVLNHISGRYPAEEILAEAKRLFAATQVAGDLERFTV
jgi:ribonuclease Z